MMTNCLGAFQRAAAAAATFELRLRLSSELVPELAPHSFDKLSKLTPRFVDHFKADLSDDERTHVLACSLLRNKVLHLELAHATDVLVDLGQELADAGVTMVKLSTGEVADVRDVPAHGTIYGWMWKAFLDGSFARATEVFTKGVEILEAVRDKHLPPP